MLETLLESKARRGRSTSGAIASVMTHTVLIAIALYATAQATVEPPRLPEALHPVYFPPPHKSISNVQQTPSRKQNLGANRRMVYIDPHVDIHLPRIDVSDVMTRPGDFSPGLVAAAPSRNIGTGGVETPFRADQVEKQVSVIPGSPAPRYPELLRSAGVEGQVIAEFVVDEEGRAQDASVRFVRSDNLLFNDAVRVALARMRFVPADVAGRKVKQLVQMPFVFRLGR
jgi:protein TonB